MTFIGVIEGETEIARLKSGQYVTVHPDVRIESVLEQPLRNALLGESDNFRTVFDVVFGHGARHYKASLRIDFETNTYVVDRCVVCAPPPEEEKATP